MSASQFRAVWCLSGDNRETGVREVILERTLLTPRMAQKASDAGSVGLCDYTNITGVTVEIIDND